ncbi:hypothetical protein EYF80_049276 [Liparis tanakae]|uniref:Uncharacterized protein n=1 Tax=Liparis tanakae TaxID=230148 RepID=A0A4Z2FI00_9TELE|nr:hypothetical protein EYF80_049276 [Liparis tanakae]
MRVKHEGRRGGAAFILQGTLIFTGASSASRRLLKGRKHVMSSSNITVDRVSLKPSGGRETKQGGGPARGPRVGPRGAALYSLQRAAHVQTGQQLLHADVAHAVVVELQADGPPEVPQRVGQRAALRRPDAAVRQLQVFRRQPAHGMRRHRALLQLVDALDEPQEARHGVHALLLPRHGRRHRPEVLAHAFGQAPPHLAGPPLHGGAGAAAAPQAAVARGQQSGHEGGRELQVGRLGGRSSAPPPARGGQAGPEAAGAGPARPEERGDGGALGAVGQDDVQRGEEALRGHVEELEARAVGGGHAPAAAEEAHAHVLLRHAARLQLRGGELVAAAADALEGQPAEAPRRGEALLQPAGRRGAARGGAVPEEVLQHHDVHVGDGPRAAVPVAPQLGVAAADAPAEHGAVAQAQQGAVGAQRPQHLGRHGRVGVLPPHEALDAAGREAAQQQLLAEVPPERRAHGVRPAGRHLADALQQRAAQQAAQQRGDGRALRRAAEPRLVPGGAAQLVQPVEGEQDAVRLVQDEAEHLLLPAVRPAAVVEQQLAHRQRAPLLAQPAAAEGEEQQEAAQRGAARPQLLHPLEQRALPAAGGAGHQHGVGLGVQRARRARHVLRAQRGSAGVPPAVSRLQPALGVDVVQGRVAGAAVGAEEAGLSRHGAAELLLEPQDL